MVEQGNLIDFHNDIEDLKNMVHNLQLGVSRYGVKFTGSNPEGERLYNAKGLIAGVGTNTQDAYNDFDYIEPWASMRRCNTAIVNGERVPTYFEGEEGYSNTDEDVFVYVPLFYYYRSSDDSEYVVSMTKLEGYKPPAKFIRPDGSLRDHTFLAAYAMSLDNGVPVSRSGQVPVSITLNSLMETCATKQNTEELDSDIWIEGMKDDEIKTVLLDIEFGTRDHQTYMMGATFMPSYYGHVVEGGINQFTIGEKEYLSLGEDNIIVVGQAIRIETDFTTHTLLEPRGIVNSVNPSTGVVTFIPSGEDVTVNAGSWVTPQHWKTGICDNVKSRSGSFVNNTSGRYPCVWRGCENPWGNGGRWRWDFLCSFSQSYVLDDPINYSGTINEHYTNLAYDFTNLNDGNIVRMGFDPAFPYARIAAETEPGDYLRTYFTDYCQKFINLNSNESYGMKIGGGLVSAYEAGARSQILNG